MKVSKTNFSSFLRKKSTCLISYSHFHFSFLSRITCLKAQNWRFFIFFFFFFAPSPICLQLLEILFPLVLKKWGWYTSIFIEGFFLFLLILLKKDTKMKWKWMEKEEIFKKLSIVHHLGLFFYFYFILSSSSPQLFE